jgi:glyoxylase-like metal-dependent hydrolase (beta-lactamase superfamily II)
VRIRHLNCGTLCPPGGRLLGGGGGLFSAAPMCCHCLLIEGDDRLILVDTGLGVEDVNEPQRLGVMFKLLMRPRLEVAETALRQVVDLGYRPSDVRHIVPTHLDLDHAGGISDFPGAAVHIYADELRAVSSRSSLSERGRYRAVQLAAVKKWAIVKEEGESWCGFSAVRAIPGTNDEVLLVPLPGHTRGHCGVAVRRSEDWLLHCGDAYFHHSEVEPGGGATPVGLRVAERLSSVDGPARRANLARLRDLARLSIGGVKLFCSHDPVEFAALKGEEEREALRDEEERQAKAPSRPVSAPTSRRPQYRDIRAAE